MGLRTVLLGGLILVLAACSASTTPEPAWSVPAAPEPPAGWVSVGSFAGADAAGTTGMALTLDDAPVAVNTTCVGVGDLVVLLSDSQPGMAHPAVGTAVRFRCDVPGATSRVELADPPAGAVTVFAFALAGAGAMRRTASDVSIEQPSGTASR